MSVESSISYAALILADADIDITADKLQAVTKAAGAEVNSLWTDVYAKALEGKELKEVLFSFAASAAPAAAPAAAGGAGGAGGEEKPAEKAPEPEEESDEDMGMGLFD